MAPSTFNKAKKLRLNLAYGEDLFPLLAIKGGNDGSLYISCPKKYAPVEKYLSGAVVLPPRVTGIKSYELTKENGFVENYDECPKISIHPDGCIQSSFGAQEKYLEKTRVLLGKAIKDVDHMEDFVSLRWNNVLLFNKNIPPSKYTHSFNIDIPSDIQTLMAVMKRVEDTDIKASGVNLRDLASKYYSQIGQGELIVLNAPVYDVTPFQLVVGQDNVFKSKEGDVRTCLVFGIRHFTKTELEGIKSNHGKTEGLGSMIWYTIKFIDPIKFPLSDPIKDKPNFNFDFGYKNWSGDIRSTAEKIVIIGQ